MGGMHRVFAGLAALVLMAGCDLAFTPITPSPLPTTRPEGAAPPPPAPSATSRALARYYGNVERDLVSRGLLRTDGGGPDVPFNARNLTENFLRIALFDEYVVQGDTFVARQTASILRRWRSQVRMRLIFGPSVPEAQQARDRANVAAYLARLQRLTGQSIRLSDANANFFVLVQNADELAQSPPLLRQLVPGIGEAPLREIAAMPRSIFCSVYAFATSADPSTYVSAVAVIRAEHPDTLRLSCLHEEIAQGLGLPNDSPNARPSVFNDDEEFGLLTRHDELLLRMLYDGRLRNGMTEPEARPIVRQMSEELLGGGS